jgi:Ran GTPase-activating protein (RanGAP) involved in mRNA processing and transport
MHLSIFHPLKGSGKTNICIEDGDSNNAINLLQDYMSSLMLLKHAPATVRMNEIGSLSIKTGKFVLDLLTNGDCFTEIQIVDIFEHTGSASMMHLIKKLKVSKRLNRLEINSHSVADEAVVCLAELLEDNKYLQELSIINTFMTSNGCLVIATALKQNKTLRHLEISHNKLVENGMIEIMQMMQYNTSIISLRMHNSPLLTENVELFSSWCQEVVIMLGKNTALYSLEFDMQAAWTCTPEFVKELCNVLLLHPSLKRLSITDIHMTSDDTHVFAQALAKSRLEHLQLSRIQYGNDFVSIFAEHARQMNIKSLNFACNSLSDITAFAKFIQENKTIEDINLCFNCIRDDGAIKIAEALETNVSLMKLELGCNDIGSRGITEIAKSLENNHSLRRIGLHTNCVDRHSFEEFYNYFDRNLALECIDISGKSHGLYQDSLNADKIENRNHLLRKKQELMIMNRQTKIPDDLKRHIFEYFNYKLFKR